MLNAHRITLDEIKKLPPEELIERAFATLQQFQAPEVETPDERDERTDRTLDHLPDVYGFWLEAWSWWDWQTDWLARQFGMASSQYKEARGRRDALERVCRAFKSRYEGTSRRITELQRREDEATMPRSRRG